MNRAFLSSRNKDIFDLIDDENSGLVPGYCWILHYGFRTPEAAILAIPNSQQTNIVARSEIPLPEVSNKEVEQIKEDMRISLLSLTEGLEEENAG